MDDVHRNLEVVLIDFRILRCTIGFLIIVSGN